LTITVSVPSAIITSPSTSFCAGGSVALSANAGTSYVWRNGSTAVGTSSTYIAKTGGSYTVIVTNASGCKDTSAVKTMTVNPVPMVSITSPANNATLTTDIFPINVAVSGTNISNVSFYNGTNLLGTDASSPFSLTTPSLPNGTYTLSAIAKNTFNCTDTAKVTVKVNKVVTGTDEEELIKNIQCFPNPFQDNLNLIANGRFDYTITDMLGNEIEKGIGLGQVSVGHSLPNGLYVIKIQAQNFERSIKVNKVR
jgi:Bacterial Ig domain/Secretion system C-terminal sorting domain